MRVLTVSGTQVQDAALALPEQLPEHGYVWIACSREHFQAEQWVIQKALERFTGQTLVDLHVSDLLNAQLPSRFDYSSHYDLMVFRRLAQRQNSAPAGVSNGPATELRPQGKRPGPPVLQRIDTSPWGLPCLTGCC
jgi:magnesium transporter